MTLFLYQINIVWEPQWHTQNDTETANIVLGLLVLVLGTLDMFIVVVIFGDKKNLPYCLEVYTHITEITVRLIGVPKTKTIFIANINLMKNELLKHQMHLIWEHVEKQVVIHFEWQWW